MANTKSLDLESGSSQNASIASPSQLNFNTTFTLEAWIRFESLPTSGASMVIVGRNAETTAESYGIRVTEVSGSYQLRAQVSGNATGSSKDSYYISYAFAINTWYHIAVTCDTGNPSATTFEFFIGGVSQGNGTAVLTSNIATINDNGRPVFVGCWEGSVYNPSRFFDGMIDDVRMWSVVRTEAQIQEAMNRELGGNETNLKAYWTFNNSYSDLTANNNDLTPSGIPTFSTTIPFTDNTTTSTSTTSTSSSTSTSTSITTSTSTTMSITTSTSTTTSVSTSTSTTSTSTSTTSTSSSTTSTSTTIDLTFTVELV